MKKEWRVHALMLAVLALISAAWLHDVYWKNKPENIQAFVSRFAAQDSLGWTADGEADASADAQTMKMTWQAGEGRAEARTAVLPLAECDTLLLSVTATGTPNAAMEHRWGFRAWLEVRTLKGDQLIDSTTIELVLESELGRRRVYALEASAREADGYQAVLTIEPVDGARGAGTISVSRWEVFAR